MFNEFDLIVVGGGPAGYTAAIHAARELKLRGETVALVEADELGGTCLNRGCIPTKTLIETTGVADKIAAARQRGVVLTGDVSFDLEKVFQYKNRVVKKMATGVGVLLRESGVVKIDGTATVSRSGQAERPFSVAVKSKSGNTVSTFLAGKIILATGSVPTRIPVPGIDAMDVAARVFTSDDLMDADKLPGGLPGRLAILGGGVIGVEMARVFRAFGCEVHIIEALPRLLPFLDAEVSQALAKTLLSRKITVSTDCKLRKVEAGPGGLLLYMNSDEKPLEASHLLLSVGRSPRTDMLSDELRAELGPDRRGFIPVDGAMKTKVPGIFAPGDINGRCMLAHAAMEMGLLAAESAITGCGSQDFAAIAIPACIFGEPEIGYIGLTEEAAREKYGDDVAIGRFPFTANGRAVSAGCRDGFVKVIRRKNPIRKSSQLLGVHIVGPCATELINEVSVVLAASRSSEISVEDWAASVHGHPTFGEALVEAAADSFGMALHLPPR